MGLRDMLLRRAAASGNHGNHENAAVVTGISSIEQRGNHKNHGNHAKSVTPTDGGGEEAQTPPLPETTHATSILYEVTKVTVVTGLETNEESGNHDPTPVVTVVTEPDPRLLPAAGGLVDRVLKAGGETSVGGPRSKAGGLWKFAYVPDDIDPELVAELKADGWSVSGIEEMRKYVADTMRRARMAVSNLSDSDRGETS